MRSLVTALVPTTLMSRAVRVFAGLVMCVAVPAAAWAQTVVPGFYATNGQIVTQVLQDSTLYVGGSFTHVGPVTGAGV
ncbi:MAG: hypothetical protein RL721_23, partial [Candidatus Eisenbacteria bacterium]